MNDIKRNARLRITFAGLLILLGLWVSTQWFARSMMFSDALGDKLYTAMGLNLYAPVRFFIWIPQFYSTDGLQLAIDSSAFVISLCVSGALIFSMKSKIAMPNSVGFSPGETPRTTKNVLLVSTTEDDFETARVVYTGVDKPPKRGGKRKSLTRKTVQVSEEYADSIVNPSSLGETMEHKLSDGSVGWVHPANVLVTSIKEGFYRDDARVSNDDIHFEQAQTYRDEFAIDVTDDDYFEVESDIEDFKSCRTMFHHIEAPEGKDDTFDPNDTVINLFPDDDEYDYIADMYSDVDEDIDDNKTFRASAESVAKLLNEYVGDEPTPRIDCSQSGRAPRQKTVVLIPNVPQQNEVNSNLDVFLTPDREPFEPNSTATVPHDLQAFLKSLGGEEGVNE